MELEGLELHRMDADGHIGTCARLRSRPCTGVSTRNSGRTLRRGPTLVVFGRATPLPAAEEERALIAAVPRRLVTGGPPVTGHRAFCSLGPASGRRSQRAICGRAYSPATQPERRTHGEEPYGPSYASERVAVVSTNNQDEPAWRTLLSFVVGALVGFGVPFSRARYSEQHSLNYSVALGVCGAAIVLAVMAGFFLTERRRR